MTVMPGAVQSSPRVARLHWRWDGEELPSCSADDDDGMFSSSPASSNISRLASKADSSALYSLSH